MQYTLVNDKNGHVVVTADDKVKERCIKKGYVLYEVSTNIEKKFKLQN